MLESNDLRMAEELAEFEYIHSDVGTLMNLAKQSLRSHWLDQAYRDPEVVRKAHKDMTGEPRL